MSRLRQTNQPWIIGIGKMPAVHDRDAKALRRSFQHQCAAVEMVDTSRLQIG